MLLDYFVTLIFASSLLKSTLGKAQIPCLPLNAGYDSIACVCNSTYCDTTPQVGDIGDSEAHVVTTSRSGKRFEHSVAQIGPDSCRKNESCVTFQLTLNKTFQTMIGFGGGVTDVAAMVISELPVEAQEKLLRSYFGPDGIEYTMLRVPIGSCDFSNHVYSYDDFPGDLELKYFAIAQDDLAFKIPLIRRAQSLSSKPIKVVGSAWSAPGWMKGTGLMQGPGKLKGEPGGEYYQAWAEYLRKFIDGYRAAGVPIWAITPVNQPSTGLPRNSTASYAKPFAWQTMGMTYEEQNIFIKKNLGPILARDEYKNVTLLITDENRQRILQDAMVTLVDPDSYPYVDGIATHWYEDRFISGMIYTILNREFPSKFIIGTEACVREPPVLGRWDGAESYVHDILEDIFYYHTGWADWNIALDASGGPNLFLNIVESNILVNVSTGEFYKQPMFYAIGHFSKFIPEGSKVLGMEISENNLEAGLETAAFLTPKHQVVIIIYNPTDVNQTALLNSDANSTIRLTVENHSVSTVIFNAPPSTST